LEKDDRITGFLRSIRDDFDDDGLRLIFADFLDDLGPGPVRSHHLPRWLGAAWVRNRPKGVRRWGRRTSAAGVREELAEWLSWPLDRQPLLSGVVHDGTTVVGGYRCWVTEPFAGEEGAIRYLRPLARHLGCVDAFSRVAWRARDQTWPGQSVRILLFPPPSSPSTEDHP
jgi:uncharacterized protein (TIGR02996 family)